MMARQININYKRSGNDKIYHKEKADPDTIKTA